jgi:hypothetical protein
MSAHDNLNGRQFRPVADLLDTRSRDARKLGAGRLVRDVYERKAAHIASGMSGDQRHPNFAELDEPIRSGSVDPVMLGRSEGGHDQVLDGNHRIIRAHQLGVDRLPVSYDWDTQKNARPWAIAVADREAG